LCSLCVGHSNYTFVPDDTYSTCSKACLAVCCLLLEKLNLALLYCSVCNRRPYVNHTVGQASPAGRGFTEQCTAETKSQLHNHTVGQASLARCGFSEQCTAGSRK
jgi:hypothetical protein